MGTSTDAIIAYGINFGGEDDIDLPWITRNDDGDNDINDWWIEVVYGYKPPVEIYDRDGNYINGIEPSQKVIDAYWKHRREFTDNLPGIPITMVMHCSYDYPMWIMAIPETVIDAHRGYPKRIPDGFIQRKQEWDAILDEFCKKHEIRMPDKPKWWLASHYG